MIKNSIIKILIITFSIFASLFFIELTGKILKIGYPVSYQESSYIGYRLSPNQKVSQFANKKVTVDEYGFRNSNGKLDKAADKNIIFIGDSVTYGGTYLDDTEIFSDISCNLLNSEGRLKYQCLNAGVNGYGIKNMIARARLESLRIDDPIFVFTVLPGDFSRNFVQIKSLPFTVNSPKRFPTIHLILSWVSYKLENKFKYGSFIFGTKSVNTVVKNNFNRENEMEIIDATNMLIEYLGELDKVGIKYILVWSPPKSDVFEKLDLNNQRIQSYFARDKIKILKIEDFLRNSNCKLNQIYVDEWHLGTCGHKIYATIIYNELKTI